MKSSDTIKEAVETMQKRLVDLTSRNRLLNYDVNRPGVVRFVDAPLQVVFERLDSKTGISIVPLPEPQRADYVESNGKVSRPRELDWARKHGITGSYDNPIVASKQGRARLQTLLYEDSCNSRLQRIANFGRLAIEETGANMLYLVIGFIEYPYNKDEVEPYLAPLISVPVSMSKVVLNGKIRYNVMHSGEDVESNVALQEKLKRDFNLVLPEFDSDKDELSAYVTKVQRVIKAEPDIRFVPQVAIGTITNYANIVLSKDLDPDLWLQGRKNALYTHPIIKSIVTGESRTTNDPDHPTARSKRTSTDDTPLPLVFDADSSQEDAIREAVVHGRNLVIAGPPGTGKSQTIANMIGALLYSGKRVLFIADKLAALDVVKRRLEDAGLGPFVLPLHGNKVNKREVLESLETRINLKKRQSPGFFEHVEKRDKYAAVLQNYVEELHTRGRTRFGVSAYDLVWQQEQLSGERQPSAPKINLDPKTASELPTELIAADILLDLQRSFKALQRYGQDSVLRLVRSHVTSSDDVDDVEELIIGLTKSMQLVEASGGNLNSAELKLLRPLTVAQREELIDVLQSMKGLMADAASWQTLLRYVTQGRSVESLAQAIQSVKHMRQQQQALEKRAFDTLIAGTEILPRDERTIDSIQQTFASVRYVSEILDLPDSIDGFLETIQRRQLEVNMLLNAIGLAVSANDREYEKTLELLSLLMDAPPTVRVIPESLMSAPNALVRMSKLEEASERYLHAHAGISLVAPPKSIPDLSDLWQIAESLQKTSVFSRILGNGRQSAVQCLQSIIQRPLTSESEPVEILRSLIAYKESELAFTKATEEHGSSPNTGDTYQQAAALSQGCAWMIKVLSALSANTLPAGTLLRSICADPDHCRFVARNATKLIRLLRTELDDLRNLLPRVLTLDVGVDVQMLLERAMDARASAMHARDYLLPRCQPKSLMSDVGAAIKDAVAALKIAEAARNNIPLGDTLGDLYRALDTNVDQADQVCQILRRVQNASCYAVYQEVMQQVGAPSDMQDLMQRFEAASAVLGEMDRHLTELRQYVTVVSKYAAQTSHTGPSLAEEIRVYEQLLEHRDQLLPLAEYQSARETALQHGLQAFVEAVEDAHLADANIVDVFRQARTRALLRLVIDDPKHQIGRVRNLTASQASFRESDQYVVRHQGSVIAQKLVAEALPPDGTSGSRVDDKSEMQLLRYMIPQTRPRLPLRKLLGRAGAAIQELKPCFMMSPHAVAQYLVPGEIEFDVVIIDEASQVRPEEALGSIARGKQLVVVGDNQQLPPTAFFMKQGGDVEEEDDLAVETQSILSLAESHIMKQCRLTWHYRSRHQSLISFSNSNFYDDNLIVFPSPYRQVRNLGIYGVYIADAVYANTMNIAEAKQCVETVCRLMQETPSKSIGVVTLNKKQAELIQRSFDEVYAANDSIHAYVDKWEERGQPFFIKNLENVQGDERDSIVVCTTFGPAGPDRKVAQNFGPISRLGGEKRLNVLFSRARERLTLITSLRPEDIVIGPTTPKGTQVLRAYLEYARGVHNDSVVNNDDDLSPFMRSMTAFLQAHGYTCHHRYGESSYRLEIAVEHPTIKGQYIAAIESDGDTYANARTPRDRDRIRHEVMSDIGWKNKLIRVWSIDWYRNRDQEQQRILLELQEMIDKPQTRHRRDDERWVQIGQREETITQHDNKTSTSDPTVDTSPVTAHMERVDNAAQAVASTDPVSGSVGITAATQIAASIFNESTRPKVGYGDVVQYVDVSSPDDVLTIRIIKDGKDDIEAGVYSINRPIARLLFDRTVGDEVTLRLPSGDKRLRQFRIMEILPVPK